MYKGIMILFFLSLLYSCNQGNENLKSKIILNKILTPISIKWDTLPSGFGEGIDLLHSEFEIVYITDSTVNKITTNNEIDNDSILIVTPSSVLTTFKILSINQKQIIFSNNAINDTIFYDKEKMLVKMNNQSYSGLNHVSKESYARLKSIIKPNTNKPPNEIQSPK